MGYQSYFFYLLMISIRYFVFAGLAFLVFYILYSKVFAKRKIQAGFPSGIDYRREIIYSMITMAIFALNAYLFLGTSLRQHTRIYDNIGDRGYGYFFFTIVAAIFIHDTYFYWAHRIMHHPRIFKWVHLVHHRSTNPSPWASHAFHPAEAFIEAGVIIVIVFLMPVHPFALLAFLMFMMLYNVYGHLGYEFFPKWLMRSSVGKWLNTSTNHNMHHQFFKDNYGLYFRFWDEWMNTTHPRYKEFLASGNK